jgi:hypothetical protein
MRNPRNVIIAFLIVACLVVTIGFAALIDNLVLGGRISSKFETAVYDKSVYFTHVKSVKNCMAKISDNGDTATITIFMNGMDMVNGKATAEAVINIRYLVDFSEYPELAGTNIPDITLGECVISSIDTVHFKSQTKWEDGTTGKGPRTLRNGDEIAVKISVTVEEASIRDVNGEINCRFDITIPINGN